MPIKPFTLLLVSLSVVFALACDRGFDETTGVYTGKGVTATFPTGWQAFSGVPHSVVARRDPDSSAKLMLSVQDAPGATMEEYLQQVEGNRRKAGMKGVDEGSIEVDGVEGRWAIVDQEQQGKPFRGITYSFLTHDQLYMVMGLTEVDEFESWKPRFDEVAKSVDFE